MAVKTTATGGLSKQEAGRVGRAAKYSLATCTENQGQSLGTLEAELEIDVAGRVSQVMLRRHVHVKESCAADKLKKLSFAKRSAPSKIKYRFSFYPPIKSLAGSGGLGAGLGTIGRGNGGGMIGRGGSGSGTLSGSGRGTGYGSRGAGVGYARWQERITKLSVSKGLDASVVRRVLHRFTPMARFCREKSKTQLAAKTTISFSIDDRGKVTSASHVDGDKLISIGACVARAIQRVRFPQPTQAPVDVTYELVFSRP